VVGGGRPLSEHWSGRCGRLSRLPVFGCWLRTTRETVRTQPPVARHMGKVRGVVEIGAMSGRILLIRGERVIVDADLAEFYGVTTKRLNEQVKRNRDRFPDEFAFELTAPERIELVAKCDHLSRLKFARALPHAFTEHDEQIVGIVRAIRTIVGNDSTSVVHLGASETMVLCVPGVMTKRQRRQGRCRGKSDDTDAQAIAEVVLWEAGYPPAFRRGVVQRALRLGHDQRDGLVRGRAVPCMSPTISSCFQPGPSHSLSACRCAHCRSPSAQRAVAHDSRPNRSV
jgi:hypothetical protein